jgi:phage shock protein A
MGIIRRLSNIVSANMEDLVESYENPEPLLKQTVREMESALVDARQQTARAMANEKRVRRELEQHERETSDLEVQAIRALEAGDEPAARQALQRKKRHAQVHTTLEVELRAAADAVDVLRQQLESMVERHQQARQALGTLSARQRAVEARRQFQDFQFRDDPFSRFDRLSEKVQQAECEVEAMRELSAEVCLFDRGADRSTEPDEIDRELSALKRQVRG